MLLLLLFIIPFITSVIIIFGMKNYAKEVVVLARISAICSLLLSTAIWILIKINIGGDAYLSFTAENIAVLGDSFGLTVDALSALLCLLNAIIFVVSLFFINSDKYKNVHLFIGLLMLMASALFGVFLTTNVLIFYVFWELTLVPAYFLCSWYGGERRVAVTFKFFMYTFLASIFMLIGILYIHYAGAMSSFALNDWINVKLTPQQQLVAFWLFIFAVAVKLPVFPFHTWQPDTYQQTATPITMVLSAIMVKMGVYLLLRFMAPVIPVGIYAWGDWAIVFAAVGIIYASIIALTQTDIKRLVAYASIAHMGLMAAAFFAENQLGIQGIIIQMFNHGINIVALWVMVIILEDIYKTTDIRQMGGLAKEFPLLAVCFSIIVFANIGLPLTNGFIGEWLMFGAIIGSTTGFLPWLSPIYGLVCMSGMILGAIYMLRMLHKILFSVVLSSSLIFNPLSFYRKFIIIVIIIIIVVIGVYPQIILSTTESISHTIQQQLNIEKFLKN
ncbi:MAG: complex I subunit 4 family protein [Chitinophagaceae bacterium]